MSWYFTFIKQILKSIVLKPMKYYFHTEHDHNHNLFCFNMILIMTDYGNHAIESKWLYHIQQWSNHFLLRYVFQEFKNPFSTKITASKKFMVIPL
jgi:hypothetical protein